MIIKKVPGLHPERVSSIIEVFPNEDGTKLITYNNGSRWNGVQAAEQMKDGSLYYLSFVASAFLYRRWEGGQYVVVRVDTMDITQTRKQGGIYRELGSDIAIYLQEGLHPDDIFDIIVL